MDTKLDDILPPMFLFSQFCDLVQVVMITHEKYLTKNIQLKKPKKKRKRKKMFRQVAKICHQKKKHC
jgi:hypothetical protein